MSYSMYVKNKSMISFGTLDRMRPTILSNMSRILKIVHVGLIDIDSLVSTCFKAGVFKALALSLLHQSGRIWSASSDVRLVHNEVSRPHTWNAEGILMVILQAPAI